MGAPKLVYSAEELQYVGLLANERRRLSRTAQRSN